MLDVSFEVKGQTVHVVLSGRMDGGPHCRALRYSVKSLVNDGKRHFVFDLSGLVSMSSRGIGCLVSNYASITAAEGGTMALRAPNERVRHVLEVTRLLGTVFEVIDSRSGLEAAPPPPRSEHDEDQGSPRERSARAGDLGEARRRRRQHQTGHHSQGARPRR